MQEGKKSERGATLSAEHRQSTLDQRKRSNIQHTKITTFGIMKTLIS